MKHPEPFGWITFESQSRLERHGGNESRGTVPVHAKRSNVADIPLYSQAALDALARERDSAVADRNRLDREHDFALIAKDQALAEAARLREALAPFAALAHLFDDENRGGTMPRTGYVMTWPRLAPGGGINENALTVEHLQAARAALTPPGAKENEK